MDRPVGSAWSPPGEATSTKESTVFRRRRNDEQAARPDDQLERPDDEATGEPAAVDAMAPGAVPDRSQGPFDVSEVEEADAEAGARLDLGSLRLRPAAGMEVQLQLEESTGQVVAVLAVIGQTALQLQPFAAPRTEGIWDEVRTEIAAGLTTQGGTCAEADGPFGTELRAQVPAALPDGSTGFQHVRFLGVDGPRWFLRGVISGAGALDPSAAAPLEDVFRQAVVVRGDVPMAPRSPIPLQTPQPASAPEAPASEEADPSETTDEGASNRGPGRARHRDDLKPFERGPEITEVR
jgi:hypothetical protein